MEFQVFSKNYLDILTESLFQHLSMFPACLVICYSNLNEILLLLILGKSIILPLSSKASSSL